MTASPIPSTRLHHPRAGLALPVRLFVLLLTSLFLLRAHAAHSADVALAWNPSIGPGLAGYRVHYGHFSRQYTTSTDVGNQTTYRVQGLQGGTTYYFAVTAYSIGGFETDFSVEASGFIPLDEPANEAPVALDGSLTTAEDTQAGGSLKASDADGDPLTFSIVANGALGTARLVDARSGTYTYTPSPNVAGTDHFTFRAYDGALESGIKTVAVTITPVNDAPVAAGGSLTTAEDTQASGSLKAQDADGDPLTFSIVANGALGTARLVDARSGAYTYTPSPNVAGTDRFTFRAYDGALQSGTGTVAVTITPVNDAPVAADGSLATARNRQASGTLVASDADGDPLTFTIVVSGALGTASLLDARSGTYTYTPSPDVAGTDHFTFRAYDGALQSGMGTVTVTITATNHAPVALDGSLTTAEDTQAGGSLRASDADGDPLTFSIVANGALGTARLVDARSGAYTYTPSPSVTGTDRFTFRAYDGAVESGLGTVTVTITPVNHAPVALGGSLTTAEDRKASGSLRASDADGDPLTFSIVANGALGTGTLVDARSGAYTYTPSPNVAGTDHFTFRAHDGALESGLGTVTVTITPVNDAPVAIDGSLTTAQDTQASGSLKASDADGDPQTFSIVGNGALGTARLVDARSGAYTYTPSPSVAGTDHFTFRTYDGAVESGIGTVTVTIMRVNHAPVALDGSLTTAEDRRASGTLGASDADGDPLAFSIAAKGALGTATLVDARSGAYTYTPSRNANGTDHFTFRACDGMVESGLGTVTVTITPVNDPPVAANDAVTTDEDRPVGISPLANDTDLDGDALSIWSVYGASNGTVVVNADNTLTYTPNPRFSGAGGFTYTASDGLAQSTATVTVAVGAGSTPLQGAPGALFVATDDWAVTDENVAVTIAVLANDVGQGREVLGVWGISQASNGTALANPDGTVTYTPNPDFNGEDSFGYCAWDGVTRSHIATVVVTVAAVSHPTAACPDSAVTDEDRSVTVAVLANDVDPDGHTLAVWSVSQANSGAVVLNANDTVTYTPNPGFSGTDTFTYVATDGQSSDASWVSVAVLPVDTPPTITSPACVQSTEDEAFRYVATATDPDGPGIAWTFEHLPGWLSSGEDAVFGTPCEGTPDTCFRAIVSDGFLADTLDVAVTVQPVDDPPVVSDIPDTSFAEDGSLALDLGEYVNDVDDDPSQLRWTCAGGAMVGVSIDPSTHVAILTAASDWSGTERLTFTVRDNAGETDSDDCVVSVLPVNDPPKLTCAAVGTGAEGRPYRYVAVAQDADNDVLTFKFVGLPPWLSVTGGSTAEGTPTQSGVNRFAVIVSDGAARDTLAVRLVIASTNVPPVITSASADTATEDVPYQYIATAVDPDGTPVITFLRAADWLVASGDTLSGTPREGEPSTEFMVTATDGVLGDVVVVALVVRSVNDPPRITSATSDTVREGLHFKYVATATDPDGPTLTWTFDQLPGWLAATADSVFGTAAGGGTETVFRAIASDGLLSDTLLVSLVVSYAGDFNADGEVDLADFVLFVNAYGTETGSANWPGAFDLDGDGQVGLADLTVLVGNYGKASSLAKPARAILSGAWLSVAQRAGTPLTVTIRVEGLADPSGYGVVLQYDTDQLVFKGMSDEAPHEGAGLCFEHRGRVVMVTRRGDRDTRLIFESRDQAPDGAYAIQVVEAVVLTPEAVRHIGWAYEARPTAYRLYANVPNPFNPHTEIAYDIPAGLARADVTLSVHNILGQLVRRLISGETPGGRHSVIWDGRNDAGLPVSSGIYICLLRCNGFVSSHRMVLIR